MNTFVRLYSYAGTTDHPIKIIGETPKRYRVEILKDFNMRGWRKGDIVLVPKHAVIGHCEQHGNFSLDDEDGSCPNCLAIAADWCAGAYGNK